MENQSEPKVIGLSDEQKFGYLIAAHDIRAAIERQQTFLQGLATELKITPSEWTLDDHTLTLRRNTK